MRELTGAKESGMGRVVWDLRMSSPDPSPSPEAGGFFGPPRGPRVAPGEYVVKFAVGAKQATGAVRVEEDPRIQIAEADRAKLNDALMRVYDLAKASITARKSLQNLKTQLTTLQTGLKNTPDVPKNVNDAVQKLSDDVANLQKRLTGLPGNAGGAGPPLPDEPRPLLGQIFEIGGGLDSYTGAPTADEVMRIEDLAKQLRELLGDINKMIEEGVPRLNKQMSDAGLQIVNPGKRIPPP
jgi:small-conductance mechanosensitive channel